MKAYKIVLLCIAILAVAGVLFVVIVKAKPDVEKTEPVIKPPLVRVQETEMIDLQLSVSSQGTVTPRTESQLVPEVSGRVIEVAPGFASGGFFEEGDLLVRIDSHDYRQAVVRAEADVARMKLALARAEAEADLARREWEELGRGEEASPLTLHEPQLEDAGAGLAAAEAALETARRNLDRTKVLAPYAGRVREKLVDVGQFVTVGTPLARLYAVDYAEIRLPLPDRDLAYLDLPLSYRGQDSDVNGPEVILRAEFAGRTHQWKGRIVRTEGEIDRMSRMVHAVARVGNPYGRNSGDKTLPLAAGMFVDAEILGRKMEDVVVLPRAALRGERTVYVIDNENRLLFREVDLVRATDESIIVGGGLSGGEIVCLSHMEAVTDGMKVRTGTEEEIGS